MEREAWQATVHGVAKSRTRLSDSTNNNKLYSQKEGALPILEEAEATGCSQGRFFTTLLGSLMVGRGGKRKRVGVGALSRGQQS